MTKNGHSNPQAVLNKQLLESLVEASVILIYLVSDNTIETGESGKFQPYLTLIPDSSFDILENRGLITGTENRIKLTNEGKLAAELLLTVKNNSYTESKSNNWWDEWNTRSSDC